jgi:hypothetical protein
VRECWLVRPGERRLGVIAFEHGHVADEKAFRSWNPIRSRVLPDFSLSVEDVLGKRGA